MLSGRVASRLAKRRPCHNASAADQQDPAVSEGACAQALRAHPHELLSVAVARLIFRTRLAPGLIVTLSLSSEDTMRPLDNDSAVTKKCNRC